MSEDNLILRTIIVSSILTIISFIVTAILTQKVKSEKNYVRNPEEVIEPILAEAIIDRKIGAKELIMSCIVELIHRGNLKNIENDKIQLINYNNISEYEMEILQLIFKNEGQIVTFDDIKEIFVQDNKKTKKFFNKFKIIKQKIENKLFDYKIYSKLGEKILKILKIISLDIIFISIYVLFAGVIVQEMIIISDLIKCIIITTFIAVIIGNIRGNLIKTILNISIFNIFSFVFWAGFISIAIYLKLGVYIIGRVYNHWEAILLISTIIILNIIILIKTNTHIFTEIGKSEFSKIQGLKQYIVDYSLMKERDLDSVIIWDEYLAYAVAFGIPNRITDKLGENLMNTNVILQKIEAILKLS